MGGKVMARLGARQDGGGMDGAGGAKEERVEQWAVEREFRVDWVDGFERVGGSKKREARRAFLANVPLIKFN